MDINTIVLIVILVVMVYALTDHWKEKNTQAVDDGINISFRYSPNGK